MNNIEIKHFAPVLIPTLCRFEHLKECLESLSKCTWAGKTEVYIAVDYPYKESQRDGHKKISEYLETVDRLGFKNVEIIRRETNCGVGHSKSNMALLINQIKTKYDRWIFTEDDNVFSANFLDYVNKALEIYENDNSVETICGYNFPIDMGNFKESTYLSHYYSAWGIGIWKNKREDCSIEGIKKMLRNRKGVLRVLFHKPFFLYQLFEMLETGKIVGDYYHMAYCMINDKYNLLPKISLVRNIGQDGSGLHSTSKHRDLYLNQAIDENIVFSFSSTPLKGAEIQGFRNMWSISFYRWFLLVYKTLKYYINI